MQSSSINNNPGSSTPSSFSDILDDMKDSLSKIVENMTYRFGEKEDADRIITTYTKTASYNWFTAERVCPYCERDVTGFNCPYYQKCVDEAYRQMKASASYDSEKKFLKLNGVLDLKQFPEFVPRHTITIDLDLKCVDQL